MKKGETRIMFTSFNAVLPTYEVIVPQTKQSFKLRSMTVGDEEKLKASLMNESKILAHLNKCLYDAITEKPEGYTLKKFLESVTLKDRDALLYGLYHITYEEIRNYSVTCGNCNKSHDVTVNASDTFSMEMYPGKEKEILKKVVSVPLKVLKGVVFKLKQPTLNDENEINRRFEFSARKSNDIIMDCLIIDSFEQTLEESTTPMIFKEFDDIISAYETIPAKDKNLIKDAYKENFGKYQISLKMKVTCPSCGKMEVIDIDLVDNFFRAMY